MKHVVSEFQDESHWEPEESSDKNKSYGECVVAIEEPTELYLASMFSAQAQYQAIEHSSKEVQLSVLYKDVFTELATFFQYLFIVDVG